MPELPSSTGLSRQPDPETRKAELLKEVDAIHAQNRLFWPLGERAQIAERAAYHLRIARLNLIRVELAQLSPIRSKLLAEPEMTQKGGTGKETAVED